MYRMLLFSIFLAMAPATGHGDDETGRKAKSAVISIEIENPEAHATLETRSVHKFRIDIDCKDKDRVPKRYMFGFYGLSKQKLIDGQFIGETKVDGNGESYCEVTVKAPSHVGNYKLVVEPVPVRSLRKTAEEKVSAETTLTIVKTQ